MYLVMVLGCLLVLVDLDRPLDGGFPFHRRCDMIKL